MLLVSVLFSHLVGNIIPQTNKPPPNKSINYTNQRSHQNLQAYSAFTLATSEPCQTGLVSFSMADISRTTGTWQVPVVLLISAFENETKPVWHGSEVASVNAL